jgi:hypothetical protein
MHPSAVPYEWPGPCGWANFLRDAAWVSVLQFSLATLRWHGPTNFCIPRSSRRVSSPSPLAGPTSRSDSPLTCAPARPTFRLLPAGAGPPSCGPPAKYLRDQAKVGLRSPSSVASQSGQRRGWCPRFHPPAPGPRQSNPVPWRNGRTPPSGGVQGAESTTSWGSSLPGSSWFGIKGIRPRRGRQLSCTHRRWTRPALGGRIRRTLAGVTFPTLPRQFGPTAARQPLPGRVPSRPRPAPAGGLAAVREESSTDGHPGCPRTTFLAYTKRPALRWRKTVRTSGDKRDAPVRPLGFCRCLFRRECSR